MGILNLSCERKKLQKKLLSPHTETHTVGAVYPILSFRTRHYYCYCCYYSYVSYIPKTREARLKRETGREGEWVRFPVPAEQRTNRKEINTQLYIEC